MCGESICYHLEEDEDQDLTEELYFDSHDYLFDDFGLDDSEEIDEL